MLKQLSVGLMISPAIASAQVQPRFEVVSIKPTGPEGTVAMAGVRVRGGCYGGPGSKAPGMFHCGEITLPVLVAWAYHVQRQYVEHPKALDEVQFEVYAKLPEGSTKEQIALMIRTMLEERFKLKAHSEERRQSGYELTVGRGELKLTKSGEATEENPSTGYQTLTPEGWSTWTGTKVSMKSFANFLTGRLQQPVSDITGLPGLYDITVTWAPPQLTSASSDGSGPTMFEAVQKLGLKLVPAKESVTMIVVDHAEKMPTEN